MAVDHVLIAVADAPATAASLWRDHGLRALEGGLHPGWGTGNWIVPLGRSYLELVRIEDPGVAAVSSFGRRAAAMVAAGGGPYAWCIAPLDFEATVARLGLEVEVGSRRRPDGTVLAWRPAGLEVALEDPSRPFFIHWLAPPDAHPGRSAATHRLASPALARLEVAGDELEIGAWLGDTQPPILVRPGAPAITAVVIRTADAELVLGPDAWHCGGTTGRRRPQADRAAPRGSAGDRSGKSADGP